MRDTPYFQTGEWIELKLENDPDNGFYQIENVFLDNFTLVDHTGRSSPCMCYGYKLVGLEDRKFHGSALLKLFDTATQTFSQMMEDLTSRSKL